MLMADWICSSDHKFVKRKKKKIRAECSIPFDIQEEIIKRIPEVKSVIRFRSVSKTWKSVIDSPLFVKDHTRCQRQHHPRRHLLVTYTNTDHDVMTDYLQGPYYYNQFEISDSSEEKYLSMVDDDDSLGQHHEVTFDRPPLDPYTYRVKNIKTSSSSHGLVCVYPFITEWKTAAAVIWNPWIRKSIHIDVLGPWNDKHDIHKVPGHVVGFGVCPRTLEPKLVKITWGIDDDFDTPWQVEVYSLSSPGVWRSIINHNLPPRNLSRFRLRLESERTEHVVVDHGFIYWLSTYFDDEFQWERNMIISFDVSTEEFTQVYLPDRLADHHENGLDISTRMDSLIVIQHINNEHNSKHSRVWKMKEHAGGTKTFTKLFKIFITPRPADGYIFYEVHGFRNNGEPIIESYKRKKHGLYSYERSGHIKFTGFGVEEEQEIECVSSYTETLLLLDQ